jgi:hypothetical protein
MAGTWRSSAAGRRISEQRSGERTTVGLDLGDGVVRGSRLRERVVAGHPDQRELVGAEASSSPTSQAST